MRIALGRTLLEDKENIPITMRPNIYSQDKTFPMVHNVPVRVLFYHDTLRLIIGSCTNKYRVYLKDIIPKTSCSKIKVWKNELRKDYIVKKK